MTSRPAPASLGDEAVQKIVTEKLNEKGALEETEREQTPHLRCSSLYDGNGNRVLKVANGVTTRYLVDDLNQTGYMQVAPAMKLSLHNVPIRGCCGFC